MLDLDLFATFLDFLDFLEILKSALHDLLVKWEVVSPNSKYMEF